MDEERTRILRMLAEGRITAEECEELLEALSTRHQSPQEEGEETPSRGRAPWWAYLVLALLVLLAVPAALLLVIILRTLIPFSLGAIAVGLWIWMILDCLARPVRDFRLIFTRNHEHEKWIWVAIVVLTFWPGALAYFIVIRQPAQAILPPK